eukprot:5269961-Pyramimonas_sp.AAC.1
MYTAASHREHGRLRRRRPHRHCRRRRRPRRRHCRCRRHPNDATGPRGTAAPGPAARSSRTCERTST